MKVVPFDGELDAPVAEAKAPAVVPFDGALDPGPDTTASDDAMRAGDPMGIVAQEQYKAPEVTGSVFDNQDQGGPRMDAPTNDAAVNERALDNARKSNPAIDKSPMYSTGLAKEKADSLVAKGQVAQDKAEAERTKSSGSTAQDVALNVLGGFGGTVNKAGATISQAFGAEDAEAAFDSAAEMYKKMQADNGGGMLPGKVAGFVGSVAPAIAVSAVLPAAEAYVLLSNAGLFALPAFRDTLKEKLAAGQDFPLALAHASQSFGLNLFLPNIASKGGALLNTAAGKGIIGNAASAAAEGAGFSAATTALDKGTDLVAGEKNEKNWLDLEDMGTMALGFGAMRGIHAGAGAAARGVSAGLDRVGTPSQQFGRALGQDVDAAGFNRAQPANLNPNLRDVVPKAADPVAEIFKTGSVEEAAAAAARAADVPIGEPDTAAALRSARPPRPKPVEPTEGALDERAPTDVRDVPAGADGAGPADARGMLDVPLGDGSAERSAVDTRGGERAPEAGNALVEPAVGDAAPVKESRGPAASDAWKNEGKSASDLIVEKTDSLGSELARQVAEEASQKDFSPLELHEAVRQWAADEKVPADELRQRLLHHLASRVSEGRLRQIRAALDPTRVGEGAPRAEPFATKPEANMAALKEDAVAVPAEGGWTLQLKTRPYSDKEVAANEADIAAINDGLNHNNEARAEAGLPGDREPVRLLSSAPTAPMVVGRRIGRLLGVKVVFVEDHPGFSGVALRGVAYVSPQAKHPELAIIGHEVTHGILQRLRAEDPARAQALHEQLAAYVRQDAVDKKQAAEPDRSRKHAEEEVIADLNGSMWLDPKFWAEMRKADPSTFRKIAYAFMQAITKVTQNLSRFKASDFTDDVESVRKILAREMAQLAREEAVESHSPTEKQELGIKDAAKPEPLTEKPEPDATAAALVKSEPLTVTFGGKTYRVESAEDAAAKWNAFRQAANMEGAGGVSDIGNGVKVMAGGRVVATVAYNGRVKHVEEAPKFSAKAPERKPGEVTREEARQMGDLRKKAQTLQVLQAQGGDVYKAQLSRADRAAILESVRQLRADGVPAGEARKQAVERLLEDTHAAIEKMQPGKPAFSRKEDKPFYSALARGIEGINAKSQPAEGWRAQIQGLVNSGKVKADEVEWSGLADWLKLRAGKVSKQEVQDFIAANGVQVHEVTHQGLSEEAQRDKSFHDQNVEFADEKLRVAIARAGDYIANKFGQTAAANASLAFNQDRPGDNSPALDRAYELLRKAAPEGYDLNTINDAQDEFESAAKYREHASQRWAPATKYGSYTLPGGENYREVLLTLPVKGKPEDGFGDYLAAYRQRFPHSTVADGEVREFYNRGLAIPEEGKIKASVEPAVYRSGHWDEPNILAHIRLNDRTDSAGKKTLFVEELQSDWAQEGRKKGFRADKEKRLQDLIAKRDSLTDDAEAEAVQREINEMAARDPGVTKGPFVDKTDAWLSLALKRVIKLAADEGYDKVAFVNGEQSADRYDLSKQVRTIEWTGTRDGNKTVSIEPLTGNTIEFRVNKDGGTESMSGGLSGNEFTGKKLDDVVGKDVAEKIMGDRDGSLSGNGLKVGGSGMRTFYDSVVPQALSKLLPKFGGKAGTVDVAHPVEDYERTARYVGPAHTYQDVARLYEISKRHHGDVYDNPLTGVREEYPINRVSNEQDLRALTEQMRAGKSFAEAMVHPDISGGVATLFGGKIERFEPEPESKSHVGFDVTDAMREKTAGGVPMFSRKEGDPDQPAKPAEKKPVDKSSHGFHTREIQVDGKWRPIEDSTGRLLARGDFRAQQNLYRWLGDSKAVDERGRPLVLYHGTNSDFSSFDKEKVRSRYSVSIGYHFTSSPEAASRYADKDGGNIMPVYVQARNPIVIETKKLSPEVEADLSRHEIIRKLLDSRKTDNPYDSVIVTRNVGDEWDHTNVIVFDPAQVKSAIGNRGTYDDSPDIRFARKGTDTTAELGDDKGNAEGTKLPLRLPATDVLNKARGLVMLVAPMSAGEQTGQAASQQFINNVRAARMGWDRVDGILRKEFTPTERKEMMLAGEDENRRILEGENSTAKGLSVLSKKQRDHMYALHDWSTELWDRAKQAGMVEGDGVPFWTPRMAVLMVDGLAEKLPEGGGQKMAGEPVGRNLSTTAPSMKERKHPYLRESEAALKAKFGEDAKYVDDVLAMPHAMQKFENAIIGREFVNRIKEIGLATGQDIVATGKAHDPNYFTLPHPALVNAKPKFVTDAETGKKVPAIDQNGGMLFESDPLYIKREWEGPIKAVLSTKTNAVYTGYMLLKSKAMTAIMYSPLIHQQVIFGRALAYSDMASGGPFKTVALYFTGHAAKKDDAFMRKMVEAGLVPIGDRHNMLDVSDLANGDIKKSGGWMDPDESWISLTAQKAGNAVKSGAGDKIKSGLDAVGDIWHNSLLWRRIGDLQAGIAKDAYEKLTAKGFSDKVAATAAAHLANRYAGSIGSENMSKLARGAGNVALFSLSFNAANVGTVKDAAFGTTAGLNALIKENAKSPMEAAQIQQFLKNKARWGLVKDYAYFVIGMNLANLWFQRDKDAEWDFKGSVDRGLAQELKIAQRTWMHMTLHPTDVETYLSAMTGSQDNEPGKENRVHMGNQEGGRAMYMRLPTGKVVEDLVGWFSDPAKLASAKQSPFLRAVIKGFENERDQYGSPIRDPKDPFYKRVADTAKFILSTHFPSDQVQTLMDLKNGVGTPLDKEKIKGNLTGLTVSQGHPLGPEAGVAAKVEEANKMSTLHAMPQVRHYLKYGMEDEARALLEEKTTLTPKEINKIIRKVDEPKGQMSSTQRRNFQRHSVDADQDRMDNVTR